MLTALLSLPANDEQIAICFTTNRCHSTSTLSVGTGFLVAAYRGDRFFMKLSIIGRAIGAALFLQGGGPLRSVAAIETVLALVTGTTLWLRK
jgi:hypothetical protein